MVLKSAFLLAVSASLVLTTQALTMRDTPLYKRSSAEKEIKEALLDQRVADCVEKSIGLGGDPSYENYVEQVLACVNIAMAQDAAQGMSFVSCENQGHQLLPAHHSTMFSPSLLSFLFFVIHRSSCSPGCSWFSVHSSWFSVHSSWFSVWTFPVSSSQSCRSW